MVRWRRRIYFSSLWHFINIFCLLELWNLTRSNPALICQSYIPRLLSPVCIHIQSLHFGIVPGHLSLCVYPWARCNSPTKLPDDIYFGFFVLSGEALWCSPWLSGVDPPPPSWPTGASIHSTGREVWKCTSQNHCNTGLHRNLSVWSRTRRGFKSRRVFGNPQGTWDESDRVTRRAWSMRAERPQAAPVRSAFIFTLYRDTGALWDRWCGDTGGLRDRRCGDTGALWDRRCGDTGGPWDRRCWRHGSAVG